ncbi:T9SS type A sorting domain-containing protein [Roseivirga sp. BDSF3-8]|uniref:T9SS type A sorting domain-containing protein n=1 Tax=Roseivirga sp. BDSF3-8 TaxID=3241598 RepID=UPI003531C8D3
MGVIYFDYKLITDDQGRTILFTRLRNPKYSPGKVVIDGRAYESLNEAYAFVMINPDGSIEWVKVFDEILFSISTFDVVEDKQGRLVWAMKQYDHLGTKTLLVVMGKNGNEIGRYASDNYGRTNTLNGFSLVVDDDNETYLFSYQKAGTKFIDDTPLPVTSQYLHRFDEDMNLIQVQSMGSDIYETALRKKDDSKRLYTRNREYLVGLDKTGNEEWQIPYNLTIRPLGSGDSYIYLHDRDQNELIMYDYEGETVGTLDVPDERMSFITEDTRNNIHLYIREGEFGFGEYKHVTYDPIASDIVPIPAGSTSFTYEVRDTLDNRYSFDANFMASQVAEDIMSGEGVSSGVQQLSLYPNPAVSETWFTYPEALPQNMFTLTDLSGRVVSMWKDVPATGFSIPRNGLPQGVYLWSYEDGQVRTTGRLIYK